MSRGSVRRWAGVLVGHGERGGQGDNAVLLAHADAISRAQPELALTAGVLSGEPTFEAALRRARDVVAGPVLVYPFFMSAGYFVATAIPKRIADAGLTDACRVLAPLGMETSLAGLIFEEACAAAARRGLDPFDVLLLLAGHGSTGSRASREATERVAGALRDRRAFAAVETAFLEEPPFLADQLSASRRPTVVVGYFSGEGLHAAEDVPRAIAASGADAIYTGPIGAKPGIAEIIGGALASATG